MKDKKVRALLLQRQAMIAHLLKDAIGTMGAEWEDEWDDPQHDHMATFVRDRKLGIDLWVTTCNEIDINKGVADPQEIGDPVGDIAIGFGDGHPPDAKILKLVLDREASDWEVAELPGDRESELHGRMRAYGEQLVVGDVIIIQTVLELVRIYIDWKRFQS